MSLSVVFILFAQANSDRCLLILLSVTGDIVLIEVMK